MDIGRLFGAAINVAESVNPVESGVKGAVSGLFEGLKTAISIFKLSETEKAQMDFAVQQAELQCVLALTQAQTEINKVDAAHPNWFVSGWRPAAGWMCVGGIGYQVILRPLIQSLVNIWMPQYVMVTLDIETLGTILFGMLGLGVYRTYEKHRSVARA